jgi:hypothetical protein
VQCRASALDSILVYISVYIRLLRCEFNSQAYRLIRLVNTIGVGRARLV